MGHAGCTYVMVVGKKTIDTLKATKNQTKTASLLRLSFSQVHSVMERAVKRGMSKRDKNYVFKHICMDEKSVSKGHNYITIVYDGDDGSVIDCAEGRTSESANGLCASAFTEEQRQHVETACTDMWNPFINAVKTYFPKAKHCHDMYHCVSYLNDAVDKVRRWETKTKPQLKKTRYIWLKDQANYTDWQQEKYNQLKDSNLRVAEAWAVKEQFRQLIKMPYDGDMDAYMFFDSWFRDALSLKLTAIEGVAFMFKRHLKGIVRAWVTKASNGKAERMNGSIQEIKTIGRGYATAKRFRTAILFFYGKLDLY